MVAAVVAFFFGAAFFFSPSVLVAFCRSESAESEAETARPIKRVEVATNLGGGLSSLGLGVLGDGSLLRRVFLGQLHGAGGTLGAGELAVGLARGQRAVDLARELGIGSGAEVVVGLDVLLDGLAANESKRVVSSMC